MNTYLMTKGGRIPTGSAGGHPRDEKKPRTEDKEREHGEGEPLEKGSEAGPSRRRNTPCSTPWSKWRAQALTVPAL